MEILLRLLVALLTSFVLFFGISYSTTTPGGLLGETPDPNSPTFESLHTITSVEALILESFPVQIHLNVTGYQPDGCQYPVVVRQERDGNKVTVSIFRNLPLAAACPMMIVDYNETIPLEGAFEPGTYTIDVNGTVITVTV